MAFTSSPETQTYSSPRMPAATSIELRPDSLYIAGSALTQDAGMVNLVPSRVKSTKSRKEELVDTYANTRQPITAIEVVNSDLINRGCYVWEKTAGTVYYFSVNGTGVYTSTDATTWTQVNTLLTSATTPVRFTEFIDDSNQKKLVMVDGVEGYVYTTNAAGTKITDVDFPTPHVPFPVFLDGYIFLAKAGTGDIYNSNLNDPTAWTAGDFISSELYPDDVQALLKINNYILAVGLEGSEFFYDAANASGSPLARYEGGSLAFGTKFPNAIASNKRQAVILSNNNDGEFVLKVVEDFKSEDIDPGFLTQALNSRLTASSNSINAAAVRGYFLRQAGDVMYVINFQGDTSSPNSLNKTFALNIENGYWTELRIGATGDAPYPVYFTANSTTLRATTYVSGHYGGTPFFGHLSETASAQDVFTNGAGTVTIYTELRTPNLDFDTANIKTMSRFGIDVEVGNSTTTTSGSTVTMSVYWSDDDYATWTTARELIFGPSLNYPFITQLGAFRRRAFKLVYAGTVFLRLKSLNMDINKGQQ